MRADLCNLYQQINNVALLAGGAGATGAIKIFLFADKSVKTL
jgi:hypothetical protein